MSNLESNVEDVAALRRMAREFTEGVNGGDVERLMCFYGDSYVDINLRKPVQSHAERRQYFMQVMRRGLRVRVLPDEIVVHGEIALVRGRIDVKTDVAEDSPTELRYLEVVRKTPQGWKAFWGMDGPVQEYNPLDE